jgi:thermostable 8-oxoguanine DNA glycosylase
MLKNITPYDLEEVKGIGYKTSRFFVLHSQPYQRYVVLDTHLLAHMRDDLGILAPKSTPSSKKKYLELEEKLMRIIDNSGKTFAEYDLDIWRKKSKN